MGLDMYLTAKKFFWNDYTEGARKGLQTQEAETIKKLFPEMSGKRLDYVIFQIGYWRKSNQIHKWFVDNVQNGEDDCGHYEVPKEKLKELLELCKQVLKSHKKAQGLLPNASGFFFGSQDYDKYYFQDLKETVEILEFALKLNDDFEKGWSFEYHSSW